MHDTNEVKVKPGQTNSLLRLQQKFQKKREPERAYANPYRGAALLLHEMQQIVSW